MTERLRLTRRQRWIVAALTVAIAATRVYALSRSLWDWDEALFSVGVRSYDVTQHHPHPPGFPLFMLAAKLMHLAIPDEFRAVQAIVLLGAIGLFPALFFLARELRFPFVVAAGGAALYAFFPAVWLYGGTAFSDIPATTLVLAACALLLRGNVIAGAALLGVAAGFRTQNLLIGCAPALYACWPGTGHRGQGTDEAPPVPCPLFPVPFAIALGALIVLASYAGAAYASADPPRGYLASMATLRDYVHNVDSVFNPHRPPLRALLFEYFVHPIRSGRFDYVIDLLAAAGFAANWRRAAMTIAIFFPFQLFAWLMLDPLSVSRYGTAWLPMYALLAAAGAHVVAYLRIDVMIVAAVIARLAFWTIPAINIVRSTDSPPVAAMRAIHSTQTIYVHRSMSPFADDFLASQKTADVLRENDLPFADNLYVCECIRPGRVYARPLGALWNIVRRRYFAVTLTTANRIWHFGDGWHDEEGQAATVYRWMSARSVTMLAPARRARLTLTFDVPAPTTLTVQLNGRTIDRVACAKTMSKTWDVDGSPSAPNGLVLSTDRAVKPRGDVRELALRLDGYDWVPLR